MHSTDLAGAAVDSTGPNGWPVLKTAEPTSSRLAYKPAEVAERLGVSVRYVWTLIETGELNTVPLAGRKMVLAEDLDAFIERLKAERDAAVRGAS